MPKKMLGYDVRGAKFSMLIGSWRFSAGEREILSLTSMNDDLLREPLAESLAAFRQREDAGLPVPHADELADRAVSEFRAAIQEEDQGYLSEAITLIAEMALSRFPEVAKYGVAAIFQGLVEPFNDSFEPRLCDVSDRIIAQAIGIYRAQPSQNRFDLELNRFGLRSEAQILARKAAHSTARPQWKPDRIKRILLLSRVTVGADVAVTGVLASHLKIAAQHAELVMVGPGKLRELFGGADGIRFRETEYERGGGLASRFDAWLRVLEIVALESSGIAADELAIVDPDSRLTQLGLLPVTDRSDLYYLFDSRRYGSPRETLGQLAAQWAAEMWALGATETPRAHPVVALLPEMKERAEAVVRLLRDSGRPVIVLSLGTGGNAAKRISPEFEQVLSHSLAESGVLIIDSGVSESERANVDRIVNGMRKVGRTVAASGDRRQDTVAEVNNQVDVLAWDGGIGSFAGLIAAADYYVGYDSAGQHIAAALGRPACTIFVNNSSEVFGERWRPWGPARSHVLSLRREDALSTPATELVKRVIESLRRDSSPGGST